MHNELVSVVLPIYKVEKYLDRCIESVVNQTYPHLEIILVDDGSPDRCPQICEDWAAKDSRIRVIHKENAGIGMARNTGIEHARGTYIFFFDSDDYVAPNTIELAYSAAQEHQAQVVCFGHHDVDSRGKIVRSWAPSCPKPVFTGAEVQDVFLPNLLYDDPQDCWNLNASACMAMFSMELIHSTGWRFVSEREILSEDIYSIVALYKHVQRVAVVSEALYSYCRNSQSISRSYRPDRFIRNVSFYKESLKLCDQLEYSDDVRLRLSSYLLSNTIGALKQLVCSDEPLCRKISILQDVLRHKIWQTPLLRRLIHHETRPRKVLLWCILHRHTLLCYLLCWYKGKQN